MNTKFVLLMLSTIAFSSFNCLADTEKKGFFFSGSSDKSQTSDLTPFFAPDSVKNTIAELESLRPHLNETCIFGAAMLLHNMGDDAKNALEEETQCIHTLVIFKQRYDAIQLAKVNKK